MRSMNCKVCGFAASDSPWTVCPVCKTQGTVSAPPGGRMPAYAAQSSQADSAVWTPASPVSASLPVGGRVDREALRKQQQLGMTLSWCGLGVTVVNGEVHGLLFDVLFLLSLSLYCIGYGHYAVSKGYARWIGWLLSLVLFGGGLILKLLPDKNKLYG